MRRRFPAAPSSPCWPPPARASRRRGGPISPPAAAGEHGVERVEEQMGADLRLQPGQFVLQGQRLGLDGPEFGGRPLTDQLPTKVQGAPVCQQCDVDGQIGREPDARGTDGAARGQERFHGGERQRDHDRGRQQATGHEPPNEAQKPNAGGRVARCRTLATKARGPALPAQLPQRPAASVPGLPAPHINGHAAWRCIGSGAAGCGRSARMCSASAPRASAATASSIAAAATRR
jgi:hypothetical protein